MVDGSVAMFDNLMQKRRMYYLISAVIIGLGILAIGYSWVITGAPFRLGVDFLGGTRFEVQFTEPVTEEDVRSVFTEYGISNPTVTALRGQSLQNAWQIRAPFVTPEESQRLEDSLAALVPLVPGTTSVTSMSPAVGHEVTRAAFIAVGVAALIILVYIMVMFRQLPNPVRYGVCAVTAMLHDLLVMLGFVAIMGLVAGWEIDALFLTAVLTVVGFSLQDTIVVFDRIRENQNSRKLRNMGFESLVNLSISQVFKRSVITQLNAMFVMIAILLFGGDSVKPFIAVLFVGLLSGTYSSIFVATPLLVSWEKGELPLTHAQAA
ncbi:MAG TPA: protein translocase subunit SecF [Anaerolineae bacterium]|nr:protein translocase subunit SecF [Anaerolineae bacterium]